jgi:myo-inositol-1(or 4)-monophosphatase
MPKAKWKADHSPVTEADRALELLIKERLLAQFPGYGFIGEELPETKSLDGLVWVCDPIDGTWSFLNKELTVSIALALLQGGKPVLGIVYNPITEELFTSEGSTALANGVELPMMKKPSLERSIVNLQISPSTASSALHLVELWAEGKYAKLLMQGGSVAYALAKVAEGVHNVYVGWTRKKPNIWDVASGIHLIETAGGVVTDVFGRPFKEKSANGLIASADTEIHREMVELVAGAKLFDA